MKKIKINKKNALLAGHRAGVPCCPVSRVPSKITTGIGGIFLCVVVVCISVYCRWRTRSVEISFSYVCYSHITFTQPTIQVKDLL